MAIRLRETLNIPVIAVAVLAILSAGGCIKEKPGKDTVALTLSPDEFTEIPFGGTTLTMEVFSNSDWRVTNTPAWCEPEPANGSNDGKIELKISPWDGETSREGTISVAAGTLVREVNLYQMHPPAPPSDIYDMIKDEAFREELKAIEPPIDTDGDGKLSPAEAAAVKSIDLDNHRISSVVGIKFFTGLERFTCYNTNIGAMDLSGMKNLRYVDISMNDMLYSFSVSGCSSLEDLFCHINVSLETAELRGVGKLRSLSCYQTSLKSIDLAGLESLTTIESQNNRNLTTLNISGCSALTMVDCSGSPVGELDVAGLSDLEYIYISTCLVETIDLTGCNSLKGIECKNGMLRELEIKDKPAFTSVNCSNTSSLTVLEIINCPATESIVCDGTYISSLNITELYNLKAVNAVCSDLYFIYVWWDPANYPLWPHVPESFEYFRYNMEITELVQR